MKTSISWLIEEARFASVCASIALLAFIASVIVLTLTNLLWLDNPQYTPAAVSPLMGSLLGVFATMAFVSMVISTYRIVRCRAEISDWKLFLAFVWLVPYFGIAVSLGIARLKRLFKQNGSTETSGSKQ